MDKTLEQLLDEARFAVENYVPDPPQVTVFRSHPSVPINEMHIYVHSPKQAEYIQKAAHQALRGKPL